METQTWTHVGTHTRCTAAAGQTQLGSDIPSSRLPYCLKPEGEGPLCSASWERVGPRVLLQWVGGGGVEADGYPWVKLCNKTEEVKRFGDVISASLQQAPCEQLK